ncbi:MAG: HTH-type transcriptional regulator NimR [Stenotrophomonas maltophilia]|nr:MAG: HTH-type transcriptional regulator NimR [Stenotrophomonas maltophilia]
MNAPALQTFGDATPLPPVIAQAIDYPNGAREIAHLHHRAQMVYAMRGVVRVITPLGLWTLSPGEALLIGSRIEHELQMVGAVSMRTLYIDPQVLEAGDWDCRLIPVGDLLRSSVLGMFDASLEDAENSREALLVPLILRLLRSAPAQRDGRLPLPLDRKLRTICQALIDQPANNDTLERWSEQVFSSARTLARLFRQETGMTFGQWREQLRLSDAISKLSIGLPIAVVAQELGYGDVRTFSAMFKRVLGCTPQRYRARRDAEEDGPAPRE